MWRRLNPCAVVAILGLAAFANAAGAVDKTFIGTAEANDWLQDANWDPAGIPVPEDDVILGAMRIAVLSAATSIRNFRLEGQGELTGTGTLTVLGHMSWIEGNMRGQPSATTSIEGGMDLPSGNGSKGLIRRAVNLNGGTSTMSGPQSVIFFNNGTINLAEAAVFEANSDGGSSSQAFVGTGTFNNAGTFRKTAGNTGATRFQDVVLNNDGTVEILSGALELSGGTGASGSTFTVASGAELRFAGTSDYDLDDGSLVTGDGRVVALGNPVNVSGTWNVRTTEVAGGVVTFVAPVTIANLVLSEGEVDGDQTLTVTDSLVWTQGGMVGTGETNAENGMDLSGGSKTLTGRTINLNGGTATLTGLGSEFRFFANATFNNNAVFQVTPPSGGGDGGNNFQGIGSFNNGAAGTFRALAPIVFDGVRFDNAGTVEIGPVAQLDASGGYRQTAGVTRLGMSSTLSSLAMPVAIEAGMLTGSGTVQGSVVNAGALGPGLSPGPIFIVGDYTQAPSGRLLIEIGGRTALSEYDAVEVDGAAMLAGALEVSLIDGFVPDPGDEFTILSAASVGGSFDTRSGLVIGDGLGLAVRIRATEVVLETVVEDCANEVDDDGDGAVDCADAKCAGAPACIFQSPTPTATPTRTPTPPGATRTPSRTSTESGGSPTRTSSATPTASPGTGTPSATPTATPTASPTTIAAPSCAGDCDANDTVSIDELARSVDLATRSASAGACPASDRDGNDRVSVDEVISAVNKALRGCP